MRVLIVRLIFLYIGTFFSSRCDARSGYYEEVPKVFNGGVILGANFSQVDGDTYYGYHKVGLNVGGTVYVHFNKWFGASMELLYSQKGSRGETVVESPYIGTYVTKYFMNVNYVEVPLTLHFIDHGLDFEVGVSYARLMNSNEWILSDQQVIIDPIRNAFNSTDLEYVFGVSKKLYRKLYANIRFEYSITSIRSNDRIPVNYGYGNEGQYNNLFNFRLLYLF